jgi:phosphoglycerate dehydrogenase-like enzyme
MKNVFLTPHIAGSQGNEVQRMSELVVDQMGNLLTGKPVQYEVTKEMLSKMA